VGLKGRYYREAAAGIQAAAAGRADPATSGAGPDATWPPVVRRFSSWPLVVV